MALLKDDASRLYPAFYDIGGPSLNPWRMLDFFQGVRTADYTVVACFNLPLGAVHDSIVSHGVALYPQGQSGVNRLMIELRDIFRLTILFVTFKFDQVPEPPQH